MFRTVTCSVLLAAMIASACAANAASTAQVSLTDAAENASLIETRHSSSDGAAVTSMKTQYFANEEMSVSWDDQQVLVLCREAAYLKIPATKLKAGALTSEQRQMIVYQALMSGPGLSRASSGRQARWWPWPMTAARPAALAKTAGPMVLSDTR